jgi:hypothetical protein
MTSGRGGVGSSSGGVVIESTESGRSGTSGDVALLTGESAGTSNSNIDASSGSLTLSVGRAQGDGGQPGGASFVVGYGRTGDGGMVHVSAGESTGDRAAGGATNISAGAGFGGAAISVRGADSGRFTSGSALMASGESAATSSGDIAVHSSDAGDAGVSGAIALSTGSSTNGAAGSLVISSGGSATAGGGHIEVRHSLYHSLYHFMSLGPPCIIPDLHRFTCDATCGRVGWAGGLACLCRA